VLRCKDASNKITLFLLELIDSTERLCETVTKIVDRVHCEA